MKYATGMNDSGGRKKIEWHPTASLTSKSKDYVHNMQSANELCAFLRKARQIQHCQQLEKLSAVERYANHSDQMMYKAKL